MPEAYFGTLLYTVEPGDTLYDIAQKYNTTISNILKFNWINNPDIIYVGQSLVIPASPPEALIYTVEEGDTLYSIAEEYDTSLDNLIKYNYLVPPYTIYPGEQLVVTASLQG